MKRTTFKKNGSITKVLDRFNLQLLIFFSKFLPFTTKCFLGVPVSGSAITNTFLCDLANLAVINIFVKGEIEVKVKVSVVHRDVVLSPNN